MRFGINKNPALTTFEFSDALPSFSYANLSGEVNSKRSLKTGFYLDLLMTITTTKSSTFVLIVLSSPTTPISMNHLFHFNPTPHNPSSKRTIMKQPHLCHPRNLHHLYIIPILMTISSPSLPHVHLIITYHHCWTTLIQVIALPPSPLIQSQPPLYTRLRPTMKDQDDPGAYAPPHLVIPHLPTPAPPGNHLNASRPH